jgi:hypothetical protein
MSGDNYEILENGGITRNKFNQMDADEQLGWLLIILKDLTIAVYDIRENII